MEPQEILDALAAFKKRCERDYALPPLGSQERPCVIQIPGWVEDRAREEGTTSQEVADKTFPLATRVEVVR